MAMKNEATNRETIMKNLPKPKKIHVVNERTGEMVYNRLWDCGADTNTLTFNSGYGFVKRDELRRQGLVIKAGWKKVS